MSEATRQSWKFVGYTWLGLAVALLGIWATETRALLYLWVLAYAACIGLFVVAAGVRLIQREGAAPFIFSAALMWFGPQLAALLAEWFRRIMP